MSRGYYADIAAGNTGINPFLVALVDDLMTRTTQIVLDPESGNGPKLKEPRR